MSKCHVKTSALTYSTFLNFTVFSLLAGPSLQPVQLHGQEIIRHQTRVAVVIVHCYCKKLVEMKHIKSLNISAL